MPEKINVILDDGTGKVFDASTRDMKMLPETGGVTFITKDKGTQAGLPIVRMCFTVQLPDGSFRVAQTTMTLRLLQSSLNILKARYPQNEG